MRVGQWLEKNGFHRTENRGARADSQCQRDCADECKTRAGAKPASGITQVGNESADHVLPAVRAHLVANQHRAAELQPGLAPGFIRR